MLDSPESHNITIINVPNQNPFDKLFNDYMNGDGFSKLLLIPNQSKLKSDQDILKENHICLFKELEKEYLLIKTKGSNLPRRIRDIVERVYLEITKK